MASVAGFHRICVAVPSIIPFVGPTEYVFPFEAQYAETVKWVGVTESEVIFHPKVIVSEGEIL